MPSKFRIQPLCRYCGKPIPKHTTTVYFGHNENSKIGRTERPKDKAEAQRYVNGQVMAVRYYTATVGGLVEQTSRYVGYATVWDGESYKDDFFCSDEHAKRFGYLFAREGKCTTAYQDALKQQGK